MKKYIIHIFTFLGLIILGFSCADETGIDINEQGSLAALPNISFNGSPVFDGSDASNASVNVNFDVDGDALSYRYQVIYMLANGSPLDTMVLSIDNLPNSMDIGLIEFASNFGVMQDDIAFGDSFLFQLLDVTLSSGLVLDQFSNTSLAGSFGRTVQPQIFVSCTYDESLIAGTYTVQPGGGAGVGLDGAQFEVVVGNNPNEYVIVDIGQNLGGQGMEFGGPARDFILTVNPATGITNIPPGQVLFNFGFDIDPNPNISPGFTFSCVGLISLTTLNYGCCGGPFPLVLLRD